MAALSQCSVTEEGRNDAPMYAVGTVTVVTEAPPLVAAARVAVGRRSWSAPRGLRSYA